jgi:heptosyltransferase III
VAVCIRACIGYSFRIEATQQKNGMKILVVSRAKLGDLLLTTPMLRVLRNAMPDAEIHLLANEYNVWVADGNECIDRRWTYGRVRTGRKIDFGAAWRQVSMYAALKMQRYDVAIAAGGHESHRAIARTLHASAKHTVAYALDEKLRRKVSDSLTPDDASHESTQMVKMLEPLGIKLPAILPPPEFHPPQSMLDFADRWLASKAMSVGRYLLIGMGARVEANQPSCEQILRWAKWAKETHALDTVFIWTPGAKDNPLYPGDDDIAQIVLDAKLPYLHPFRGQLKEAIGIVFRARASILPDSGMMHFAAASPGSVVGLFADVRVYSNPAQWAPIGARATYLEAEKSVKEIDDRIIFEKLARLIAP